MCPGAAALIGGAIMFKTLLVPLDGSMLAEQALPLATTLARAAGGRLVLFRAVPAVGLTAAAAKAACTWAGTAPASAAPASTTAASASAPSR